LGPSDVCEFFFVLQIEDKALLAKVMHTRTNTHTRTHAHALTHARTHARMQTQTHSQGELKKSMV
jgi:hypothetical protein